MYVYTNLVISGWNQDTWNLDIAKYSTSPRISVDISTVSTFQHNKLFSIAFPEGDDSVCDLYLFRTSDLFNPFPRWLWLNLWNNSVWLVTVFTDLSYPARTVTICQAARQSVIIVFLIRVGDYWQYDAYSPIFVRVVQWSKGNSSFFPVA